MNLAYKHLESKLKIAELTILQWGGLLIGVMAGLMWGMYLSPFGAYLTLFSAIYLAGVPAAAAFLANISSFDLWLHVKALVRHRRSPGRFVPGPGAAARGYCVTPDIGGTPADEAASKTLDISELWQ